MLTVFALLLTLQIPDLPSLPIENFPPESRESIRPGYEELLKHPQDNTLNGKVGMQLQAYEQYELAEQFYKRAHLLNRDAFEWLYYLGTVQTLLGKKADSVANFRQALKRKPDYLPGRIRLAEALLEAGEIDASLELFSSIVKENPDSPLAHYGLGRTFAAKKKLKQSAEHLARACSLFEGFGSAHYALALVYRDLGEAQKAKEQLSLYNKYQNHWPPAGDLMLDAVRQLKTGSREHLALGIKLAESNRAVDAIREHERALELDPQLSQAHVHLIRLYTESNQFEKAEQHYKKLIEINPSMADGHYNFGVLMTIRGQDTEAAEAFLKALKINPQFAPAHNNLAYLLEKQGNLEKAVEHYRAALHNDPTYRLARFNLGRTLVALGKTSEAIEQFSQILSPEDENTPRYMYALAAVYVRTGEVQKGIEYAQAAKERALKWGQTELAETIEKDLQNIQKSERLKERNPRF